MGLDARSWVGSSPLARGLRPRPGGGPIAMRIIPARAGFTTPLRPATAAGTDHPRSRGVYADRVAYLMVDMGSSPLARGLPHSAGCVSTTTRIIPARAGFTYSTDATVPATVGSSPLARGLRSASAAVAFALGIIPARAGFTRTAPGRRPCTRDHPRSRGVYPRLRVYLVGSSPLARGLRAGGHRQARHAGIIPARAGFTWVDDYLREADLGSSPLARGLQVAGALGGQGLGIIPARAGFTPSRGGAG